MEGDRRDVHQTVEARRRLLQARRAREGRAGGGGGGGGRLPHHRGDQVPRALRPPAVGDRDVLRLHGQQRRLRRLLLRRGGRAAGRRRPLARVPVGAASRLVVDARHAAQWRGNASVLSTARTTTSRLVHECAQAAGHLLNCCSSSPPTASPLARYRSWAADVPDGGYLLQTAFFQSAIFMACDINLALTSRTTRTGAGWGPRWAVPPSLGCSRLNGAEGRLVHRYVRIPQHDMFNVLDLAALTCASSPFFSCAKRLLSTGCGAECCRPRSAGMSTTSSRRWARWRCC